MSIDIVKAISANAIKNGTLVSNRPTAGYLNNGGLAENSYVDNKPVITDIETKYDNRFDDPDYYTN